MNIDVPKDDVRPYAWFNIAGAQGVELAEGDKNPVTAS